MGYLPRNINKFCNQEYLYPHVANNLYPHVANNRLYEQFKKNVIKVYKNYYY